MSCLLPSPVAACTPERTARRSDPHPQQFSAAKRHVPDRGSNFQSGGRHEPDHAQLRKVDGDFDDAFTTVARKFQTLGELVEPERVRHH